MSAAARPSQTSPLLAAYLLQLSTHPLRTKAITLATFQFIQDILGSHLAGLPTKRVPKDAPVYEHALALAKVDSRSLKMAAYGAFISAPLGHVLVGLLQKAFAGKTGLSARVGQILASNLLVAPIQGSVYLASMAVLNGAKSVDDVVRTVKGGLMTVLRITWMTSPLVLAIAQRYIPQELWVPWFNLVQFVVGTYFSTQLKKVRLAEAKAKKEREARELKKEGERFGRSEL